MTRGRTDLVATVIRFAIVLAAITMGFVSRGSAMLFQYTPPLSLEIMRTGDGIVALVTGRTTTPRRVRYSLEVSGSSHTLHRGETVITSDPQVVSRVRFARDRPWRVILDVKEADRPDYRLERSGTG